MTIKEVLSELKATDKLLQSAPLTGPPAPNAATAETEERLEHLIMLFQLALTSAHFVTPPPLAGVEYSELPTLRNQLQLNLQDEGERTRLVNEVIKLGRKALKTALSGLPGSEDFPE